MAIYNMLRDGDVPGSHKVNSKNGTVFVATGALIDASKLGLEHQQLWGDTLRALAGAGAKGVREYLGEGHSKRQYRGFWLPPLDECRRRWEAHLGRAVQWPDAVTSWGIDAPPSQFDDGPF